MEAVVIKRICGVLFVFVVLQCVQSSPAAAQGSNPCLATTTWWYPDPIPAGWSYYGPYPGTYAYVIWAWKATCPPIDPPCPCSGAAGGPPDRKSTRLNSSHGYISYAVFCLKQKIQTQY